MRFVIQRVEEASVSVEGKTVGAIKKGFLVLVGVSETDTEETADKMMKKAFHLRIFDDGDGKTNLSLGQVGGELLIISQFTLYANCRKGNRPSFTEAGSAEHANALYEYILEHAKEYAERVESGVFGAHMQVSLMNDGPFTVVLDSEQLFD
ncbi:MAG: D-tyrosyl-tRNA(Tyr) deacylase [Lachnospiraceae bacterium]|nr:D-tyrosyl-tRNA(Tyr) deacylase [Lachnospiraceae bacterium]